MGAVSGSTKQGGDAPQRSPGGGGDVPTIVAPVEAGDRWAPSLREASAGGRALGALCDRLAGEIILRHAVGRATLDLGHGAPQVTQWVRPRAATLTVVDAVDLGRGAQVRLPWKDDAFEVAYSLRTLAHLGHDERTSESAARSSLAELARVLVPGGVAICQIDNPRSLWGAYHGIRHPGTVIEKGPLVVESDRGLTRFDTLPRLVEMLPPNLALADLHGLRVFAAWPRLLSIPIVGRVVAGLEWFARDRALLRGFGAHLLCVLRRIR
jgi:SAM-dependent methyltransferase